MLFLRFRPAAELFIKVNNFNFGNAFSYFFATSASPDGSSFSRQFPDLLASRDISVGFRHLFGAFFLDHFIDHRQVGSARIDSLGVTISNLSFPIHSLPAELRFPRQSVHRQFRLDKSVSGAARARIQNFDVFISARTKSCAFA